MADLPFGWVPDEAGLEEQTEGRFWYDLASQQVDQLIQDDPGGDTFHYRSLLKHKPQEFDSEGRLKALNQGSVGSCDRTFVLETPTSLFQLEENSCNIYIPLKYIT